MAFAGSVNVREMGGEEECSKQPAMSLEICTPRAWGQGSQLTQQGLSFQPRGHGQRGNRSWMIMNASSKVQVSKVVTVIIHRESFRHSRVAERSGKMLFVPLRQGEPADVRSPGAGLTAGTTSVRLQRDSGAQRFGWEAPKSDHEPTPP